MSDHHQNCLEWDLFITLGNVEVYAMNKNAPWTDLWGMLKVMVFSVM